MGDMALQASYPGPILLQLRAVGADTQQRCLHGVASTLAPCRPAGPLGCSCQAFAEWQDCQEAG